MECAELVPGDGCRGRDAESVAWMHDLEASDPSAAQTRLYELLMRIAKNEVRRRNNGGRITGPEVDDIAHQAAADAMVSITRKLDQFRGDSRFTTWAYGFVIFEVSNKLSRHFWHRSSTTLVDEDWNRVADRFGLDPAEQAESKELLDALHRAVDKALTPKQRQVFVAIVMNGIPLDVLATELRTNRNALYKLMFDARQKLRRALAADGYLDEEIGGSR